MKTWGYARSFMNENPTDDEKQINELIAEGAEDVIFEYEYVNPKETRPFQMLLKMAQPGDTIIALELCRICSSTLEFYHIVQGIVERQLRLLIVDSCTIDCRKVPYDPTTAAYMDLASMLYMLEVSERFSKKRSVSSGVRLERKKIGRPLTTLDDIPDLFFMYYPQYEADEISVSEFARRCKLSRPSIYKYTRIVREVNERKH